ncbi:MAG: glycoside hydrolase family 3 N-terminal domain-containing protein [Eubacteriales bacterium]|nr:glycoside hydrolase family 3 N-terminal domain-containing protein [Eubacteriales bacterium]
MAYDLEEKEGFVLVHNHGGKTLGYSPASGVKLIERDGFAFKDLNKNGVLDPYEDWRLPMEERIADLAARMNTQEIAGLMLYSAHQTLSASPRSGFFAGTYSGVPRAQSDAPAWALTDQQRAFLTADHLRHILMTAVDSAETAARWNNEVQALTESLGLGIPANNSSDPRHGAKAEAEFNAGAGGDISQWPEALGLAATFDPETARRFGRVAAAEYRALGITTALSPQIDMASEPRWMRFDGTFGESSKLSADMAEAYCDGFQTTPGEPDGWGGQSVNTMAKHWPGGGSGEGGRDAHFAYGKYAVYPGNNFAEHLIPFTQGAFALKGGTKRCSAIMPYYTVSTGQDKGGECVGNSYSDYIVGDLLRRQYGFDGVVCTDWNITHDNHRMDAFVSGKCWGMETATVARRHYKALMAGVDQFGGNNDKQPILEAYAMGEAELGEAAMRQRFEASARRLLRNIFRVGLFENPYLDTAESAKIAGSPAFMAAGYAAQQRSIVLLKNHGGLLPLNRRLKVYIPLRHISAGTDWFGNRTPECDVFPVRRDLVEKYYDVTDDPAQADFALCMIHFPQSYGYDAEKGYLPVTLQYRPYTAVNARAHSLAGGDPLEESAERSYRGKTNVASNQSDLDMVLSARKAMGSKPVVVSLRCQNPTVPAEFEPAADVIVVDFGSQPQAILDILSGKCEPSALLPFQMPADMETVEAQCEDVPFDMTPYTDADGHRYDFAFGLNYEGVITDERTKKYFFERP